MEGNKKKEFGVELICCLFILLFVYAGLSKLLGFRTFKFQLGRSPFITHISGFVAWIIPASELGLVALLAVKRTRLLGLFGAFFLMLLFTGYIFAMLHFSYYLPCSCGGVLAAMSWNQHLLFNIFFVVLALTGITLQSKKQMTMIQP
jgi:uncharacterized membrane protein YphA (DoxX/SURF4 family)